MAGRTAVWLSAALMLAAGACGGTPAGTGRTEMATKSEDALLNRVRGLELPGVQFERFTALPTPGVISSEMKPAAGWALWQELREREADLGGLVPVVVDAAIVQVEDGAVVALGESGDVSRDELAAAVAEERRRAAQLSAQALFDRLADGQAGWREWLAEATGVAVESLPPTTWPELQQRCLQAGITCPESNPSDPYLAEIDAKVDASYLGPVEHDTPQFAQADAKLVERVRVLLLATTSNDLPIALQIGGFNACPLPHEHAVALASWAQRYGARIAFYGHDIVEVVVDRRPTTVDDLRRLTREHFVYDPDVVDQGVGSTSELAYLLARSTVWYFWWD